MKNLIKNISSRKFLTGHYDELKKNFEKDLMAFKEIPLLSQAKEIEINFHSPTDDLCELLESTAHFYPNAPKEFFQAYMKNCCESVLVVPLKKSDPALFFKPKHKKLNQFTITFIPKGSDLRVSTTSSGFVIFYAGKIHHKIPKEIKREYSQKQILSLFINNGHFPEGVFELPMPFFKNKNIELDYNGKSLKGSVNDALRQINYLIETRGAKQKIDHEAVISAYRKACSEMKKTPSRIPMKRILEILSDPTFGVYYEIHQNTVRLILNKFLAKTHKK